jgi:hypothetical protein
VISLICKVGNTFWRQHEKALSYEWKKIPPLNLRLAWKWPPKKCAKSVQKVCIPKICNHSNKTPPILLTSSLWLRHCKPTFLRAWAPIPHPSCNRVPPSKFLHFETVSRSWFYRT